MSYNKRHKPNVTQEFLKRFSKLENELDSSCRSNIFDFLLFYENRKACIHPRVARKILFFELPYLCFRRQLKNSTVVSEVLLSIHNLRPRMTVPHIVLFLALSTTLQEKIAKRELKKYRSSMNYLTFILQHCNEKRVTFSGRRITEMMALTDPLLYARLLLFAEPKSVLTLLQYGLRFDTSKNDSKLHPMFLYILALLSEIGKKMAEKEHEPTDDFQLYVKRVIGLLTNFRYILRSTYNPHNVIFRMATISEMESPPVTQQLGRFFNFVCPSSTFKEQFPSRLKHLCRYVIRERLFEKWYLPNGIGHLPLTLNLANYIHLAAD